MMKTIIKYLQIREKEIVQLYHLLKTIEDESSTKSTKVVPKNSSININILNNNSNTINLKLSALTVPVAILITISMALITLPQFNCIINDQYLIGSSSQAVSTFSSDDSQLVAQNKPQQTKKELKEQPDSLNDPNSPGYMLLWDDLLHDDDEDDEEESGNNNEGEDDEDDEQTNSFYSQNPVDSSAGSGLVGGDLGADIKVQNSDFQDFDDHEALRTSEFYPNVINKTNKGSKSDESLKKPTELYHTRGGDKYQASESQSQEDQVGLSRQCALFLERGFCITYGAVEWAIRRARVILGFRRPGDLNSLEPSEASVNAAGELNELTSRILAQRFQLNWYEVASELGQIDVRRTSLWQSCPLIYRSTTVCLSQSRFRTHTGHCNNLISAYLGSSYMPFSRALPADYGDTVGFPRRSSMSGNELPPARLLALYLHPDVPNPSGDMSMLFVNWGQLVNHDLAMASGARVATGHDSQCCRSLNVNQVMNTRSSDRVCMPILIGPNDPVYGAFGIRCLDFKRSLAGLRPGCSLGPRIQLNTITSFVDASFVYGSRRSTSRGLRRFRGGLMNTWQYFEPPLKPLLPPQTENPDEDCRGRRNNRFCFLSGDSRTNQQIPLAVLHTYHTRQHNRLARALQIVNPHWSDNRLYHEARHIHIAIVQHILLNEYLPILLGPKLIEKYNLKESAYGEYWDNYRADVNPSITQAFAAAAFRQGHTTVSSEVYRFNPAHELIRAYQLRQLYHKPWALYEPGAMDEFLLGLVDAPAQSFDPFFSQELSGHLFQEQGARVGLDLVAINIQRGRDQGVAGYNAFREWCGLGRAKSFADLIEYMDNRTSSLMSQLYESVDDIDLFTGGISEFPLAGAQVGPTFGCIIGHQFEDLRAGDRFWFESSQGPHAFTMDQLESIKRVSLARLLCINSDQVLTIQLSAFQLPHPVLNPRYLCNELPDLDITLWQETPPAVNNAIATNTNDLD